LRGGSWTSLPGKGRPGIYLRLDPEILSVLRIEAKRNRLNIVDFTRPLIEAYLRRVGGDITPLGGLSLLTTRKAAMAKLRGLLAHHLWCARTQEKC